MTSQIAQAIQNLHYSSLLAEEKAAQHYNINNKLSYQLDILSASIRAHAQDLTDIMIKLGEDV